MSGAVRTSFVVRVVQDERGQVNGVIERVATGAKEAFSDLAAVGQLIQRMLEQGPDEPPPADEPVTRLEVATGPGRRAQPAWPSDDDGGPEP